MIGEGTVLKHGHELYTPSVAVTGVSFRTLDVAGREELARRVSAPQQLACSIVKDGLAEEAAIISTCNRFEVVSSGADDAGLRSFFSELVGKTRVTHDVLYHHRDASAVRHIYRVSASLDSMVLGEAQILGQVKEAYRRAVAGGSVGTYLHHLFQSAFRVAKKVRAHTAIGQHGVSVSYVAVRLAQQIFSDLRTTTVLIVGSGEMAELAALHLCSHGCQKIIVANRTVERAAELAERFGGVAVSLSDIDSVLDQADIVIGSISIEKALLTRQSFTQGNSARRPRQKPLFLIDLGMPRNFAPDLGELDSIYLYNIDDLAGIADENRGLREAAAREAELVIEYGLLQFERWRAKVRLKPEIVDLRQSVEAICAAEVERRVAALSPAVQAEVREVAAQLAQGVSQKIAHELTTLMYRHAITVVDPAEGDDGELARPFLIVSREK